MLYLNIKPGDKVFMGEGENAIVVTLERKTKDGVKLGVNAPREIPVNTIFKDTNEQFKNRRKGDDDENGNH